MMDVEIIQMMDVEKCEDVEIIQMMDGWHF